MFVFMTIKGLKCYLIYRVSNRPNTQLQLVTSVCRLRTREAMAMHKFTKFRMQCLTARRYRGYYTTVRRYKFYFRVVKTIFHGKAQRVSIMLFFYHGKIKFISSNRRVIFFSLYRQEYFCTSNSVKAGNDVIDILNSQDLENKPLESRT